MLYRTALTVNYITYFSTAFCTPSTLSINTNCYLLMLNITLSLNWWRYQGVSSSTGQMAKIKINWHHIMWSELNWKIIYLAWGFIKIGDTDYRQVSNIRRTLVGNYICRSLRCSWSIACRRCSNYIFILDLTPGFKGSGKDDFKTIWKSFKFMDLVSLILDILRYASFIICQG